MNADPKDFRDALSVEELSYQEVIEMAYYGAQVIHPKTIKPLRNKNIPLYVRSFLDLRLEGTVITSKQSHQLPPIMVYKRNQALVTLQTTDFSFVEGKPINLLYEILEKLRIKPNLTQNGAITMIICIDDIPEKTEQLAILASSFFDVNLEKGLTLLTVRHYTAEYLQKKEANTEIIMEQRTSDTIQRLMK
jgi:aspartate kinase